MLRVLEGVDWVVGEMVQQEGLLEGDSIASGSAEIPQLLGAAELMGLFHGIMLVL